MDENEVGSPEYTPTESQAREQGWVPKEEFTGEEHKWVEAGEFLRRGELFGKIESQNRELKAIRDTLNQFKDHHSKVQEAAYKKALGDLKALKKEALLDGDADKVIEVDEQLADIKQTQVQIQQQTQQAPQQLHPEFVNWSNQNSWYGNTPHMRTWADNYGRELREQGMSPSEVLRKVAQEVKNEFPNKFSNPNRDKPGAVEASPQRGTRNASAYQPNEIEERLATKFVKEGLFKNKQEYYAELQATKS